MAGIRLKVHADGLLDYAKAGKEAVAKIRVAMRRIANAGRTAARRQINAQFRVRTGFLRRQARAMQTQVTIKASQISARVKPIPRLMNIFEGGATLAHGRGFLHARPVVGPAKDVMEVSAFVELDGILREMGK